MSGGMPERLVLQPFSGHAVVRLRRRSVTPSFGYAVVRLPRRLAAPPFAARRRKPTGGRCNPRAGCIRATRGQAVSGRVRSGPVAGRALPDTALAADHLCAGYRLKHALAAVALRHRHRVVPVEAGPAQ
jgi:hypothetical protein